MAVLDEALSHAHEAERAVLHVWNAIGQPGESPVFKGTLYGTWKEYFHRHCQEILNTPASQVRPGSMPGILPPSAS